MSRRVALLHTAPVLASVFGDVIAEHAPSLRPFHLVDESLLTRTMEHGMLPSTRLRIATQVAGAQEAGAEAVLVTCSSLGEAVELCRPFVSVPVVRVDAAMARAAVAAGKRIGIVATVESTMDPTRNLIAREADRAGLEREIDARVCDGAFASLLAGDTAAHDAGVAQEVRALAASCDVLVLAQASMARVVDAMPDIEIPVLTSPRSAVQALTEALDAVG